MKLIELGTFIVSMFSVFALRADPAVEIIQSCKNMKAASSTLL